MGGARRNARARGVAALLAGSWHLTVVPPTPGAARFAYLGASLPITARLREPALPACVRSRRRRISARAMATSWIRDPRARSLDELLSLSPAAATLRAYEVAVWRDPATDPLLLELC